MFQLRLAELAALDADLVVLADLRQTAVQGLALELQECYRDAGVGEVHGDTAAHGAGAYHRDLTDRSQCGVGGDARDLQRLAFGEEQVAQGRRLRRGQGLLEQLLLLGQTGLQG
ncbi:hypothetical protein D9M68_703350 [compost metagenome]